MCFGCQASRASSHSSYIEFSISFSLLPVAFLIYSIAPSEFRMCFPPFNSGTLTHAYIFERTSRTHQQFPLAFFSFTNLRAGKPDCLHGKDFDCFSHVHTNANEYSTIRYCSDSLVDNMYSLVYFLWDVLH